MPSDSSETKLVVAISELNSKLETLIEKQEEVAENIAKIKDALYNPEQGLFSRLREVELWRNNFLNTFEERISYHTIKNGELRVTQVETTIGAIKKIQWLVVGSAVTTITALVLKHFILN